MLAAVSSGEPGEVHSRCKSQLQRSDAHINIYTKQNTIVGQIDFQYLLLLLTKKNPLHRLPYEPILDEFFHMTLQDIHVSYTHLVVHLLPLLHSL